MTEITTAPKGNPWRRWSIRLEGQRVFVDTGVDRFLVLINDGSDDVHVSESKTGDQEDTIAPSESLTVESRRYLWSPGRARVRVEEFIR